MSREPSQPATSGVCCLLTPPWPARSGQGRPSRSWRRTGGLLMTLCLLAPCSGRTAVAGFLGSCVADADDLRRLPATLAAAGLAEINPANGPRGPAISQTARRRRLWSSSGAGGERGDAFTGYAAPGPGRPMEVCWHVSRPGGSAAVALAALKQRLPPRPGSSETGTEFFHGGYERWQTRVGTVDLIVGVSWPMRDKPEEGTSLLYLMKPSPARRGRR